MCFAKLFGLSFLSVFVLATQAAYGSQESTGPNGINSSALGLTGAGIAIGQVEINRPAIAGETGANADIVPAGVFVRDITVGTNANVGLHAGCHAHDAQQREHVNYQNGSLLKNMPTQAWAWHPARKSLTPLNVPVGCRL